MKTILIIDDDLGFVFWLGQVLADAGHRALAAKDFSEASGLLSELNTEIDLLVMNAALTGTAGFNDLLRRHWPNAKLLAVLTENDQQAGQIQGANVIARKPPQADDAAAALWLRIVEQVLERQDNADQQEE